MTMINESDKSINYWLKQLRLNIRQLPNTEWVIETDVDPKEAACLMEYGGWHWDEQMICEFRKGILFEVDYDHDNSIPIDQVKEEDIFEITNSMLLFLDKGEVIEFLLPLYGQFSLKWEEETFNPNKHLLDKYH